MDGTQAKISDTETTMTAGRRGKGGKSVTRAVTGLQVHSYREGYARHFEVSAGARDRASAVAMVRRECRGLVTGPPGQGVVARPVHKFFVRGRAGQRHEVWTGG